MHLTASITKPLLQYALRVMRSRGPDVCIGGYDNPYMERWHAIPRNSFFNVYLHLYHHDDDRILHSHPWWSLSVLLNGSLIEFYTDTHEGAEDPERYKVRFVDFSNNVVVRSADMYHRLQVVPGAITIFITGPKIKTWYFACKHGLMYWKDFHSPRRGGDGCGETD